ncbi:MAG: CRTAC1 family protein [Ignavibacteria bacterium]|nr:CRTAC1 family protein [Ignavibacteria bacterium]
MKQVFALSAAILAFATVAVSQPVIVKVDNGTTRGYNVGNGNVPLTNFEESAMLLPAGPCAVNKILVYYAGATAAKDTLYIVGDPSEGAIPPTSFVWSYNTLIPPIVVDYPGTPGWYEFDISGSGVRSDGYDRIVIQHRIKRLGPFFGVDSDGTSSPLASFLYDPVSTNTLGFPGVYYRSSNDYMIRLEVVYERPSGNTSEPPPAPTMVDVTKQAGITDVSGNVMKAARVSVADWNGDGFDDIAVGANFFQNQRDGSFRRVDPGIQAGASVWADIDNDGKLDCYAVNGGAGDKVYRNDGNGSFTDITAQTKIANPYPTVTPMWTDLNNDGWLDLFIANGRAEAGGQETYYPDQLWLSNGDGSFRNATSSAGIAAGEPSPYYDCWAASACDYNDDNRTDLFVATYRLAPDLLYRNSAGGVFSEVGATTGLRGVPTAAPQYFGHGAGTEWGDLNNDGYEDLVVGNLGHPDWRGMVSNPSLIFQNKGRPNFLFEEVHQELGLKFFEMNFGVVLLDLDLDGALDIWHCQYAYNAAGASGEPTRRSRMYRNLGAPGYRLRDVTWQLGCVIHGAWTAARLDYDNDGDMDLVAASPTGGLLLFRNDVARAGRFLGIRLTGSPADKVPMDAYGAKIVVYAGGRQFYRGNPSGGSGTTASQNSNEYHFGLGSVSGIDSVVVRYPNGSRRAYTTLLPDRKYTLAYDGTISTDAEPLAAAAGAWTLAAPRADKDLVQFALRGEGTLSAARAEVFDVIGRSVLSAPLGDVSAGMHAVRAGRSLSAGMYVLRVSSASASVSAKFVVTR